MAGRPDLDLARTLGTRHEIHGSLVSLMFPPAQAFPRGRFRALLLVFLVLLAWPTLIAYAAEEGEDVDALSSDSSASASTPSKGSKSSPKVSSKVVSQAKAADLANGDADIASDGELGGPAPFPFSAPGAGNGRSAPATL